VSVEKSEEQKEFVRFSALFVGVPLLTAFAFSWVMTNSVWGTRHLIVVAPIFLIFAAASVTSLEDKRLRIGAICVIALLIAAAFVVELRRSKPEQVWCGWAGVASQIRAAESARSEPPVVYTFENLAAYHLWFAGRAAGRERVAIVKGVPVRTDDKTYTLPRGFCDVRTLNIDDINDPELWLAFRVFQIGEEFPQIEAFTSRGYLVCSSNQKTYATNRVFWVKFAKAAAACAAP
jgi:hypothetical protein